MSRILLREPLELFVVGHPFDAYPQELCARLRVDYVNEDSIGDVVTSVTFLPDEDIVEDFSSILSLLCRRLITPIVKVRQCQSVPSDALGVHNPLGSYASECPLPILNLPDAPIWKRRPLTIVTSFEGQRVINNNPPLVGIDSFALSEFLSQLPKMPQADQFIYAARLYRSALEMIETRPDIAYLLLVSTVESLADVAFSDYEPEPSEKQEAKAPVYQRARDFGLNEEQAMELVVNACKSEKWAKKKFKKFVLDFADLHELEAEDRVFKVPSRMCPSTADIPKTLGRIYDARSANVHVACPFPRSIRIGTEERIDVRVLPNFYSGKVSRVPPVTWFERIVWLAASRFVFERSGLKSPPCVSTPWTPP